MNVVWLIARREILARARSKAYIATTVILALILVVLAVVMKLVSGTHTDFTIAATPATAPIAQQMVAVGKSVDETVSIKMVTDETAGRDEVRSGKVDALLDGDGTKVHVVVKQDLSPKLSSLLNVTAQQLAFTQTLSKNGVDPATVLSAEANANVGHISLEPPHDYNTQQLVLGIIAGILIYLSLLVNGQAVAQGVVEEKSSRVVELLLATVRPWQMMAGKVAGLGIVGLIQMVFIGGLGVAAGLLTKSLTIPAISATSTLIWLVVWFLLGFVAYALAFGAAAALVSRQEDVNGVVAPILVFVIAGYVMGVSILPSNPGSKLMAILSVLPPFAPTLMPIRMAMGGVPLWQPLLGVVLMLIVIPLLVLASGRIYRNAVVRSGARLKLLEAWRTA